MVDRTRDRRAFLQLGLAAAAIPFLPALARASAPDAASVLSIEGLSFVTMPRNFTGLSYEMPQIYNPNFFSAGNRELVRAFRNLSEHGVLRLGGNLSDVTRWQGEKGDFATEKQTAGIERGKTYWEWKLTDVAVREHRDGAITPAAIRSLRSFLDATGWDLIYGLCFGIGSPERAADEAACVFNTIGPRLLAFQLGNEDDFFGGNPWFRAKGYNFDLYLQEYRQYVAAVRAVTPQAKFAGPDVANNMSWIQQFAEKADKPVEFLSGHHYAMGPAKNPEMNAERLLKAKLDTSLARETAQAHSAIAAYGGTTFRMTEGNSCYGGGKPDVSDSFASALWVADYMLSTASDGYCGVNLHGGGDGYYTPIETFDDRTATPRPMYYGMQLAEQFAGYEIARVQLATDQNVTSYIGRSKGSLKLAVINKSAAPADLLLRGSLASMRGTGWWKLQASSLTAKTGVTFAPVQSKDVTGKRNRLSVPPYSAILVQYGPRSSKV